MSEVFTVSINDSPSNAPIKGKYTKRDDLQSSSESLHSISQIYNIQKAVEILDSKDWTNVEQFLDPWGPQRITLVHLAAYRGNLEILKRAVSLHANLYATDNLCRCSLHYAADQGQVDVIKWLLERSVLDEGSNGTEFFTHPQLSLPDAFGNTPLHEAVKGRNADVVKLLVDAGSNLDVQNEKSHTPLFLAGAILDRLDSSEKSCYEKVIDILVSAKAFVNVSDPITGITPLHHAVKLGSCQATKLLLKAGARLDVQNKQGWTPLHTAACGGHLNCIPALADYGGSLVSETNEGETVIAALLKYGSRAMDLLTEMLDAQVYAKDMSADAILDFRLLMPQGELQMVVVSALIRELPDMKKMRILHHPLLEAFVLLEGSRFRYFHKLLLAVQCAFVFFLVAYTLILLEIGQDLFFIRWPLLVCACILLCHGLLQLLIMPGHYKKKFETWLFVICATISAIVAIAGEFITGGIAFEEDPEEGLDGLYHSSTISTVIAAAGEIIPEVITSGEDPEEDTNGVDYSGKSPSWILQIASFMIPFALIQVELTIAQYSEMGKYILTFTTVVKKIIMVLAKCLTLISGFFISFMILFSEKDQFLDTWKAITKIVLMMIMMKDDSDDLFSMTDEISYGILLTTTARITLLVIVLLTSIALMNLVIGLAISNTEELVKEGHTRQLLNRAEFVIYYERVTSGLNSRNYRVLNCLKKMLSKNLIDPKIELEWATAFKNPPHGFSEKLLDRLYDLASKNLRIVKE